MVKRKRKQKTKKLIASVAKSERHLTFNEKISWVRTPPGASASLVSMAAYHTLNVQGIGSSPIGRSMQV